MHLGSALVTGETEPVLYQRLMRQIRAAIISGEYPVGDAIPSTTELVTESGMSRPVVRRAIDQLKAEGILEGHQGKSVIVAALPVDADHRRADTEALGEQFAELRQEVREMAKLADSDDLRGRLGRLESRVGRIEAAIATITKRFAQPNPLGGEHDGPEKAAGRGRAGRR
jgi:DNA-binding transcriptional regulator YhcF (GntR family)